MARYAYVGKTREARDARGVVEAEGVGAAVKKLEAMGLYPARLEREDAAAPARGASVPAEHAAVCLRQIAELLEAGMPLAQALGTAAEQAPRPALRELLLSLERGVRGGRGLGEALGEHPEAFPDFYAQQVSAGEAGGALSRALGMLADHAEIEARTRAQIAAALAYPAFILVVGAATVLYLLGVVIPRLAGLFADFQQSLPLSTRILLACADLLRRRGWLLIPAAACACALGRRARVREAARERLDRLILFTPGWRDWVMQTELARFTRTLGGLLESGVPLPSAAEAARRTLSNGVLRRALEPVPGQVSGGLPLSRALRGVAILPGYVAGLVAVGEESGRLDKTLLKLADGYERRSERALKTAMSLLEPALILIIGAVLGSVIVSIMLPIFEINTLIR